MQHTIPVTIMKPQMANSLHRLPLSAAITVLLLVAAGAASGMGWLLHASSQVGNARPSQPIAAMSALSAGAESEQMVPIPIPVPAVESVRTKRRCAECGVVASMREIDMSDENVGLRARGGVKEGVRNETRAKSAKRYEITIRLGDGSHRVIADANPAAWRLGERVSVIDGANPPNR